LSYARLLNCVLRMRILQAFQEGEKLTISSLFSSYPRQEVLSGRPSA